MSDFLSFVWAVLEHWMTILGILSFLAGAINKLRKKEWALKNKTLVKIAILLLFFGCFQAWKDEHQKYVLEITKHNGLHGTIESIIKSSSSNSVGGFVLVQLSIKNLGDPTLVENYFLTLNSGKTHLFCNQVLFQNFELPAGGNVPRMKFTEKDALYQKTLEPIATGSGQRGWLIYQFPSATWSQLVDTNNQWIVSYDDASGRRYYVTNNNSFLSNPIMTGAPGAEEPYRQ